MKHIWINIDKSTHRYDFMKKQFTLNNIDNIRISAVTPDNIEDYMVHKKPLRCNYPGCNSSDLEFSCLVSHLLALQECLKYDDEYFVIMEDDILMPFEIDYKGIINSLNTDFDIIQLTFLYHDKIDKLREIYLTQKVMFIKWRHLRLPSTGMYIITKKGIKKLLDMYLNKDGKFDFSNYNYKGLFVADSILYDSDNTFSTTLPYCYPNIKMGSEIHIDHLPTHEKSVKSIKKTIEEVKEYPFVIKRLSVDT
jgi:GR25 family glycosyltransferase involved in LPS biosynthesis